PPTTQPRGSFRSQFLGRTAEFPGKRRCFLRMGETSTPIVLRNSSFLSFPFRSILEKRSTLRLKHRAPPLPASCKSFKHWASRYSEIGDCRYVPPCLETIACLCPESAITRSSALCYIQNSCGRTGHFNFRPYTPVW